MRTGGQESTSQIDSHKSNMIKETIKSRPVMPKKNLDYIDLSYSDLESLEGLIQKKNYGFINASGNNLKNLPDSMISKTNLTKLWLSNN